jgi:hypothetical protein
VAAKLGKSLLLHIPRGIDEGKGGQETRNEEEISQSERVHSGSKRKGESVGMREKKGKRESGVRSREKEIRRRRPFLVKTPSRLVESGSGGKVPRHIDLRVLGLTMGLPLKPQVPRTDVLVPLNLNRVHAARCHRPSHAGFTWDKIIIPWIPIPYSRWL